MRNFSLQNALIQVARSYVATGVTMAVTRATTAGGRRGWLPDNLNRGRLDLYYTVLVLLSAANVLFFLLVAHFYQYKKVRGPELMPLVMRLACFLACACIERAVGMNTLRECSCLLIISDKV